MSDVPPLLAGASQNRHTVAGWLGARSLRVRLLVFVTAIVGAVITAVAVLEVRSFEQTLDQEIVAAARQTARAVADQILTTQMVDPIDLRDALHELAEANPLVRSISVVSVGGDDNPELLASTLSEERDEVLTLARRAVIGGAPLTDRGEDRLSTALPMALPRTRMAAVATVSLAPVQQVREQGRRIALLFALPAIVLVTLLVELTIRAFVHAPLDRIRETMGRAARGDRGARAPIVRRDELGAVSQGLNEMLDRLESFNAALHERVREATEELRQKNAQLGETYYQMLTLREALARAERLAALGHMAAAVAHQAGTPLNLVSGYVQMLREDPSLDVRVRERLVTVETQIGQVTHVLRTMLDQARQPLLRVRTNLGEIITRVVELASPRAAQLNVRIARSVPADLPPVAVDVVQFELVLLALMSNGLDAMPGGGTLFIRASTANGTVRVEIADTGAGIPLDLIDRIFEPWMTTKPAGHGTGLGLGIARDVVRSHGGTIIATNGQQGGAVFGIELAAEPIDNLVM